MLGPTQNEDARGVTFEVECEQEYANPLSDSKSKIDDDAELFVVHRVPDRPRRLSAKHAAHAAIAIGATSKANAVNAMSKAKTSRMHSSLRPLTTTQLKVHGVTQKDVEESLGSVEVSRVKHALGPDPVSYTHLTLPTTPYV